ncbi:MAG: hypothetical protein ACKOQZ_09535, partial [Actinomycetota bacterium]
THVLATASSGTPAVPGRPSVASPLPPAASYEALRDIIVVVIHVYFIGLMIYLFVWWQKRGEKTGKELETSSYGRPLVRKS